jgi:hypothetical protein
MSLSTWRSGSHTFLTAATPVDHADIAATRTQQALHLGGPRLASLLLRRQGDAATF